MPSDWSQAQPGRPPLDCGEVILAEGEEYVSPWLYAVYSARRDRVSVSGDVDPDASVVRHSPRLGWRQVPLAARVESGTGLPTVVDNDVRALTVNRALVRCRPGSPRMAPAYVLLASDEASYISGALVPVTGGKPIL
jgi:ROK family protein